MSSSREKKNNDKWKSARGPRNERQNQRAQDTQQDYDMDSRSFEPPAEKVQMMNDGNGIRRGGSDSLIFAFIYRRNPCKVGTVRIFIY